MIDGYTVPEAASVLGVPEGRVWELLARGVIGGTPDGDSMRVHLRTAAGPPVAARRGVSATEGGGEASAFRELLTEFRNLTERYGQALLALGEARGEVAGLRTRLELLEARVDLRLPGPSAGETSWSPTVGAEPQPGPPRGPTALEPRASSPRRPAKPEPLAKPLAKPPRRSPTRRAVTGIAEALARADDPSRVVLTPRDAIPAIVEEPVREPASLPVVDEPSSPYSTEVAEPDWFADGDFAWLEAADREAAEAAPVADAPPEPPDDEPPAVVAPAPVSLSLTEDELAQLVADEGWGPSEVDTIRGLIAADEPASLDLPGGAELDAALAALAQPQTENQWSKPRLEVEAPEQEPEAEPEPENYVVADASAEQPEAPVRVSTPSPRPTTPRIPSGEPPWLRGRRGPAATAFRTLRRLLPG